MSRVQSDNAEALLILLLKSDTAVALSTSNGTAAKVRARGLVNSGTVEQRLKASSDGVRLTPAARRRCDSADLYQKVPEG